MLFDEFEKVQSAVFFLSFFDEGHLTLDGGERLYCGPWYLVLTSNLGSAKFAQMEETPYARMERFARSEARRWMRPELFGRVTDGMDIVDAIEGVKTGANDRPVDPPVIESIDLGE